MGQGNYDAIMYGVLDPDIDEVDAHGYHTEAPFMGEGILACRSNHDLELKVGHGDSRSYAGIVLWVSDECLARDWGVEWKMQICSFHELIEAMEGRCAIGTPVRRAWADFAELARSHGRTLPHGRLLFVADQD